MVRAGKIQRFGSGMANGWKSANRGPEELPGGGPSAISFGHQADSVPLTADASMGMQHLEQECGVYARYLSGTAPTTYLVEKYLDFHQKLGEKARADAFDSFLVEVSARG